MQLGVIYRGFRGFYITSGARFNFNKAEYFLAPADQVNLAPPMGDRKLRATMTYPRRRR